jgi:hypothetical protein
MPEEKKKEPRWSGRVTRESNALDLERGVLTLRSKIASGNPV